MKVDYGGLRHFWDDLVCPDPVRKLSNFAQNSRGVGAAVGDRLAGLLFFNAYLGFASEMAKGWRAAWATLGYLASCCACHRDDPPRLCRALLLQAGML